MDQYRVIQLEDYLPLKILRLLNQHGHRTVEHLLTSPTNQELNVLHRYNKWQSFIKNKGKIVDFPKRLKWEPLDLIDMFFFLKQNVTYNSYKYDCNNWEATEHLHLTYRKYRHTMNQIVNRAEDLFANNDAQYEAAVRSAEEGEILSPPPKKKRFLQSYMVCWNCPHPQELSKSIIYSKPLTDYFFIKNDRDIDLVYRNYHHTHSTPSRLFKFFEEMVDVRIPEILSKKFGEDWESWLFMAGEVEYTDDEPICFLTLETLHPVNSEKYFKRGVYWKQFKIFGNPQVRRMMCNFDAIDLKELPRDFKMTDNDLANVNPNRFLTI